METIQKLRRLNHTERAPIRLLVLSDLHLEFAGFELPPELSPDLTPRAYDAVVLAGDILCPGRRAPEWARRTFGVDVPIIMVAGNHEFYGCELVSELKAMRLACQDGEGRATNVHLLEEDSLTLELAGSKVRFLGCTLWTDFALPVALAPHDEQGQATVSGPAYLSDVAKALDFANRGLNDFHAQISVIPPSLKGSKSRQRVFTAEDTLAIHHRQRNWLERELNQPCGAAATVIVTHHGCSSSSVAERWRSSWLTPAFSSDLPSDLFSLGLGPPDLWVHGHTHDSHDYYRKGTRVVVNPRGYPRSGGGFENKAFDAGLVVGLRLDDLR
jgi:predicted phosphodiesterase